MYKRPEFKPLRYYVDTRGYSLFDIYPNIEGGQINIGTLLPGIVKGFHWHKKQKDLWCPIVGDIHVICVTPKTDRELGFTEDYHTDNYYIDHFYIGEHNPGLLVIHEGTWHGYTNIGDRESKLLYWVTNKYDPDVPDEYRIKWDYFGKELWEPKNE